MAKQSCFLSFIYFHCIFIHTCAENSQQYVTFQPLLYLYIRVIFYALSKGQITLAVHIPG